MATTTQDKAASTDRKREPKGHVTRVGNVTRDPELRFSNAGTPYARFGIAVNRPKVAGDWAGEQVTEFYSVTAFKSLAENVAECVHKGDRVIVEGEASLETWTDKDGQERTDKVIAANAVGAELRFATVTIHKPERRSTASAPSTTGTDEEDPF